jgi:hypothetical protein
MAKITSFNKENWKTVAADIEKAVQSVAKKYGITLESAGGAINDINGVFKLRVNVEGSIEEAYRKNWKFHQLPEDGLGKTFVDRGRTYTIKGFDPYKTYQVLTVRDDGVTICYKSFAVKEYFQKLGAHINASDHGGIERLTLK